MGKASRPSSRSVCSGAGSAGTSTASPTDSIAGFSAMSGEGSPSVPGNAGTGPGVYGAASASCPGAGPGHGSVIGGAKKADPSPSCGGSAEPSVPDPVADKAPAGAAPSGLLPSGSSSAAQSCHSGRSACPAVNGASRRADRAASITVAAWASAGAASAGGKGLIRRSGGSPGMTRRSCVSSSRAGRTAPAPPASAGGTNSDISLCSSCGLTFGNATVRARRWASPQPKVA